MSDMLIPQNVTVFTIALTERNTDQYQKNSHFPHKFLIRKKNWFTREIAQFYFLLRMCALCVSLICDAYLTR